jgi:hypothetical protein
MARAGNSPMSADNSTQTYEVEGSQELVHRDGDRVRYLNRSYPVLTAHAIGQALVQAATDAAGEMSRAYREAFSSPGVAREPQTFDEVLTGQADVPLQASGCCPCGPDRERELRTEVDGLEAVMSVLCDRYPEHDRPMWVESTLSNLIRARNAASHELRMVNDG